MLDSTYMGSVDLSVERRKLKKHTKVTLKGEFHQSRLAQSVKGYFYVAQCCGFQSHCGQEIFILYFFFRFSCAHGLSTELVKIKKHGIYPL